MASLLSETRSKSSKCPACNSTRFKLVEVKYEPLGMGVMKLEKWCCGSCHFVHKSGKLV